MSKILIYTKENCPYCVYAKKFFDEKNLSYEEIRVDRDQQKLQEMLERSGRRTVPQIFINEQSIGGYDDLMQLVKTGELQQLLST